MYGPAGPQLSSTGGPVATLVVVVLGVFFSNRHVDARIGDVNSRIADVNSRISDLRAYIDTRLSDMERIAEARTHLILGKIEDLDVPLTHLEERFSR
jgi:hypothetical protein